MDFDFGCKLTLKASARVNAHTFQQLLDTMEVKHIFMLMKPDLVETSPSITTPIERCFCRVFRRRDGTFYISVVDYDVTDEFSLYRLDNVYTIPKKDCKRLWKSYVEQVHTVRKLFGDSEIMRRFVNDNFGQAVSPISSTGHTLNRAQKKMSSVTARYYKIAYLDDRVM